MSKQSFQTDEERIIEKAKAVLKDEKYKNDELLKVFSTLLKNYKKLYKQHRFLTKRGDKQELEMRRMNEELSQTNELLKNTLTEGTMQIRDDLLAQVISLTGELVLTRNQLMETSKTETSRNQRMGGFLHNLDVITSSLQERIMQTRMQPIGNVLTTLPRIITTESQRLKKFIRLEIEGAEVELDKAILDSLAEPLAHLVRNACEHGIGTPSERYDLGKPETGCINVRAFYEAGQINIVVQDDGRGINPYDIRQKAWKKGLKSRKVLEQMSEKKLLSLIMMPGISPTMEAVKFAVEQQGGSIEITSERGKNTIIRLKVPLTLSIIPCLIVVAGNEKYAIPKVSVDELVCLYDDDVFANIEYAGIQEVCRLRDTLVPIVRMKELLNRSGKFTEDIRSKISEKYSRIAKNELKKERRIRKTLLFAVVKIGIQRFGLVIDQVTGSEEIVVNPIHSKLKFLDIYSGTTIMGDGTIAFILDIQGIAAHTGVEFVSESETVIKKGTPSDEAEIQNVLIFESGEQERFAVPLPLIRRVQDIESRRIEAVGSKEYITINDAPTLILRLDKLLDVSSCVEKEEMYLLLPKHTSPPFGLLISRIIDVVAVPLTLSENSHIEDGIIGTAIVKDRMTLFPDIWRLLEKAAPEWNADQRSGISDYRILLVEDTAFFRHLVKGYLESENYEVDTAENGLKALKLIEEADFDLIVSDIEMPEMDGWTFLRQMRSSDRYSHIPVLALTALDSPENSEKEKGVAFNAYEQKMDRERLLASVAQLLNS